MLIENTDREWEKFGAEDPYFGVIAHERFRRDQLNDEERRAFFASGARHVERIVELIQRHLDPQFSPARSLDFGCGVGRVLLPLARISGQAVGVDVSPSMLAEARRHCAAEQLTNVALVESDDELSRVDGRFDLVHSFIVLQHISVARGERLFARLVELVADGGVGVLHVTYSIPKKTTLRERLGRISVLRAAVNWLRGRQSGPRMQMNAYELDTLFLTLQKASVGSMHVEFTDHGGPKGVIVFFGKQS